MEIVKTVFTVGTLTLFSRFAGFIRELTMTACVGAGVYTDAFLVAVRLSSFCRRVFAEGAFSASFLPRFAKVLNEKGKKEANIVFSDVFTFLLVVVGIFSIFVIIFFPSVLTFLASGFDRLSFKFGLTVSLGRLCFPYLLMTSLSSLCCGALNAINKFALPAAMYSLMSVVMTTGMLLAYFSGADQSGIIYFASICVLISGVLQVWLLYRSLKKHGFCLHLRLNWLTPQVKDIMINMIPGIIATGVWQLNLLVDTTISSYLPTGSITCINMADRLNQFPLGTLGIALSTALLPLLSQCVAKQNYKEANRQLGNGLVFAFFLTFLAQSWLLAMAEPSVAVAFQRGKFGFEHVQVTAMALTGFAIGLPAYVLVKVFSSVYFSFGDTKTPVKFGIISVFVNILFLFCLVPFFKYFGIALCTSLSAFVNAVLLVYFSHKKMNIQFDREFWIHITVQIVAAVFNYYLLYTMSKFFWHEGLGESGWKWCVYIGMLGFSCVVYFAVNVTGLFFCRSDKWQLWSPSAWR